MLNIFSLTFPSKSGGKIPLPAEFMIPGRVGLLFRTLSRFSFQRPAPFSSSSAAHPKFSSCFSDEAEGGSAVYRHALKCQRPTTIRWQPELHNCVSLIGLVGYPPEEFPRKPNDSGCVAYTCLHVVPSPYSNGGLRQAYFFFLY